MTIPQEIANAAARPGMYFRDHYYDCFVAFLCGYDAALDHRLLAGFREWLILTQKLDPSEVSGMAWERLLLRIHYPELSRNPSAWPLRTDEHEAAVAKAFHRLIDFHRSV